jgi:hypothetical protein
MKPAGRLGQIPGMRGRTGMTSPRRSAESISMLELSRTRIVCCLGSLTEFSDD